MGHPYWPLFDVEVHTPRLTLRYIDDELGVQLAAVAARGIHDPASMPFSIPWTDQPSPELERGAFQYWWRTRAEVTPEQWSLTFAVVVRDDVVGATDLRSTNFAVTRTFLTGSWLGRAHQGQGLGKELRMAALTLGFDGLGADEATTAAFSDNAASLGVTRSLGYESNGLGRETRRGELAEILRFRMPLAHWQTIRRDDITIHHLDAARELLGL